jgi:hypothetical protein
MKKNNNDVPGKNWRAVLDLPKIQDPDRESIDAELAKLRSSANVLTTDSSLPKALANIATNAWKARSRMVDSEGEPREETKRIYRHVDSILDSLAQLNVEIRDHTGEAFDYGLPLNVITTQPTKGIIRDRVIETIKPTIYWNRQLIQAGEVVIATPAD